MTATMNHLLSIEDLSFTVPTGHIVQGRKTVLDKVAFQLQRGKATAYLGPNGAGKTSTFRILCGLSRKDQGRILFDGQEIQRSIPAKRIGFMPEQPYFYKNLSPYELLHGLGKLSGMVGQNLADKIDVWAEKLAFQHVLHQPMSACSKGQVQRVGLAQAMIHQPEFILLDEPLSGLDPLGREMVRDVLRESVRQGATLLFSSHILSDAEAICDQVVVLDQGKVAFDGAMENLITSSKQWEVTYQGNVLTSKSIHSQQLSENRYQILVENMQQRDKLIQALLDSPDQTLLGIEQKKQSLEEAFMKLLRKEGDT